MDGPLRRQTENGNHRPDPGRHPGGDVPRQPRPPQRQGHGRHRRPGRPLGANGGNHPTRFSSDSHRKGLAGTERNSIHPQPQANPDTPEAGRSTPGDDPGLWPGRHAGPPQLRGSPRRHRIPARPGAGTNPDTHPPGALRPRYQQRDQDRLRQRPLQNLPHGPRDHAGGKQERPTPRDDHNHQATDRGLARLAGQLVPPQQEEYWRGSQEGLGNGQGHVHHPAQTGRQTRARRMAVPP